MSAASRRDRPPAALAALAAGAAVLLVLPIVGLAWRAPWSSAADHLNSPAVLTAFRLSLICSLGATAVVVALGIPLAWVLARFDFRGRRLLRAAALVPL